MQIKLKKAEVAKLKERAENTVSLKADTLYTVGMIAESENTKEHGARKNPGITSSAKGASWGLMDVFDGEGNPTGVKVFVVVKPCGTVKASDDGDTL